MKNKQKVMTDKTQRLADYEKLKLFQFKYAVVEQKGKKLDPFENEYRISIIAQSIKAAATYICDRLGKNAKISITETSNTIGIDAIADTDLKVMIDTRLENEKIELALLEKKLDLHKAVEKGEVVEGTIMKKESVGKLGFTRNFLR